MNDKLILPKNDAPAMFDQIADRYDFLNRLLSFGLDVQWRKRLLEFLPKRSGLRILDLATGTADVIITLTKDNPLVSSGVGIDLAKQMLDIGRAKVEREGLSQKILLEVADAQHLPFLDNSFDCVTISFGIRNMPDLRQALLEMYRVTKYGGRIIILEFSKPSHPVMAVGHWIHLHLFVPVIGFIFSGHSKAYQYLSQTIDQFPYGERFCKILKQFGFHSVQAVPLLGGTATIYVAQK